MFPGPPHPVRDLLSVLTSRGDEHVEAHPLLDKLEAIATSRRTRAGELTQLRERVAKTFADQAKGAKAEERLETFEEAFAMAARVLNLPKSLNEDERNGMIVAAAQGGSDRMLSERSAELERRKAALQADLDAMRVQLAQSRPYDGFVDALPSSASNPTAASATCASALAPEMEVAPASADEASALAAAAAMTDAMERREALRVEALRHLEVVRLKEARCRGAYELALGRLQSFHDGLDCAVQTTLGAIQRAEEMAKEARASPSFKRRGSSPGRLRRQKSSAARISSHGGWGVGTDAGRSSSPSPQASRSRSPSPIAMGHPAPAAVSHTAAISGTCAAADGSFLTGSQDDTNRAASPFSADSDGPIERPGSPNSASATAFASLSSSSLPAGQLTGAQPRQMVDPLTMHTEGSLEALSRLESAVDALLARVMPRAAAIGGGATGLQALQAAIDREALRTQPPPSPPPSRPVFRRSATVSGSPPLRQHAGQPSSDEPKSSPPNQRASSKPDAESAISLPSQQPDVATNKTWTAEHGPSDGTPAPLLSPSNPPVVSPHRPSSLSQHGHVHSHHRLAQCQTAESSVAAPRAHQHDGGAGDGGKVSGGDGKAGGGSGGGSEVAGVPSREELKRQSSLAVRHALRSKRRHEAEARLNPRERARRESEKAAAQRRESTEGARIHMAEGGVASYARLVRSASASPANITTQLAVLRARGKASMLPNVPAFGGNRLSTATSASALMMGTRPLV